jgi:hypothetical protein
MKLKTVHVPYPTSNSGVNLSAAVTIPAAPWEAIPLPYDVSRCGTNQADCPLCSKGRRAQDEGHPTYQAFSMFKGSADCPDFIEMEN